MGKEASAKPIWLVVLEMNQGNSFTLGLMEGTEPDCIWREGRFSLN